MSGHKCADIFNQIVWGLHPGSHRRSGPLPVRATPEVPDEDENGKTGADEKMEGA